MPFQWSESVSLLRWYKDADKDSQKTIHDAIKSGQLLVRARGRGKEMVRRERKEKGERWRGVGERGGGREREVKSRYGLKDY